MRPQVLTLIIEPEHIIWLVRKNLVSMAGEAQVLCLPDLIHEIIAELDY